jgi:hypothetical protein
MSLCDKCDFWPFSYWRKQREEAKRVKEIEAEFRAQLKDAYSRHGDLNQATEQLRKNREPVI